MMTHDSTKFRSGYVTILGKPNAGKSTLLNALVGEKIAIVSDKPQTTRDRITGIVTNERAQIVFVDTPGVIVPQDRFNEALMWRVTEALEGIDVLYHLVDVTDPAPTNERLEQMLAGLKNIARFLVLNKVDKDSSAEVPEGIDPNAYDEVIRVSALQKKGLSQLLDKTFSRLKPGPLYYDPEQLSDRDERFLVSEIVREKVFHHTGAEVPYSVYTEVESFEERPNKDFIRVTIYVERDSQKGILIGGQGKMLKTIGQEARKEIEELTQRPAYLELWVKVRKNWRKSEFDLANFGFKPPKNK